MKRPEEMTVAELCDALRQSDSESVRLVAADTLEMFCERLKLERGINAKIMDAMNAAGLSVRLVDGESVLQVNGVDA